MKGFIKKAMLLITACVLGLSLAACKAKDGGDTQAAISMYAPDGAPALAMSKLIHDKPDFGREVTYTVVAPTSVAAPVQKGTADMAIIPTNVAVKLYNINGAYRMAAVTTQGNLYVAGTETITSLDGLKGQVLGVIGRGAVPDLIIKSLLRGAEIPYVEQDTAADGKVALRYYSDGQAVIRAMKQDIKFGLLAEPAATNALKAVAGSSIVLDLQNEWRGMTGDASYPQSCLVVKKELAESSPALVKSVVEKLRESAAWVGDNLDAAKAAVSGAMAAGTETTVGALTKESVARCNISVVTAADAKASVQKFVDSLIELEKELESIVGGKQPDDAFYATF